MRYRIDPGPPNGAYLPRDAYAVTVAIVGCGGTGALLARHVARLLAGHAPRGRVRLALVDHDRVEPRNLLRQDFTARDLGRHKAEVVAARLVRDFDLAVTVSTLPYLPGVHARLFDAWAAVNLLVGAVDNGAARRALRETLAAAPAASAYRPGCWWLDLGNGRESGQLLLGNALDARHLRGAFDRAAGVCRALPAPSLQRPDLLDAPPPAPRLDCAEAVLAGEQSPTINAVMAAHGAAYIERLLAGTCDSMAEYLDLASGAVARVPADPARVARLAGMRLKVVAPP